MLDINRIIPCRRCLTDPMSIFFNGCRDGHYDRGGEEILKYDRVQPNAGEALNPQTGIFTCPVPGTYMFIIHLSTHKDKVSSIPAPALTDILLCRKRSCH